MRRSNFAKKSVVKKRAQSFQASLNEASMRWLFEAFPGEGEKIKVGTQNLGSSEITTGVGTIIQKLAASKGAWNKDKKLTLPSGTVQELLDLLTYRTEDRIHYFYNNYQEAATQILNDLENVEVKRKVKRKNKTTRKDETVEIDVRSPVSDEAIKDFEQMLKNKVPKFVDDSEDDDFESLTEKAKEISNGRIEFIKQYIKILETAGFKALSGALRAGALTFATRTANASESLKDEKGLEQFQKNLASLDVITVLVTCLSNVFSQIYTSNEPEFNGESKSKTVGSLENLDLEKIVKNTFVLNTSQAKLLKDMEANYYSFTKKQFSESVNLNNVKLLTEWNWFDKAYEKISNFFTNRSSASVLKNIKPLIGSKDLIQLLKTDFDTVKRGKFIDAVKKHRLISTQLGKPNTPASNMFSGETSGSSSSAGAGGTDSAGGAGDSADGTASAGGAASAGAGGSTGGTTPAGGAGGSTGGTTPAGGAGGSTGGAASAGAGGSTGGAASAGAGGSTGGAASADRPNNSLIKILGLNDDESGKKASQDIRNALKGDKTTINVELGDIGSLSPEQKRKLRDALVEPEQELRASLGTKFTESKQRNSGVIVERWQQLAGLIK